MSSGVVVAVMIGVGIAVQVSVLGRSAGRPVGRSGTRTHLQRRSLFNSLVLRSRRYEPPRVG